MSGYIKVIAGEMFSGKSTELARLIERALIAGLPVQVFVPDFSQRGSLRDLERRLVSMPGRWRITPVPGANAAGLDRLLAPEFLVIAIDEAQFFDESLIDHCRHWRSEGRQVLIAGLDLDYREQPFGYMGQLMCLANQVIKLHAVCNRCRQQDAYISFRLSSESAQVVVGESNYTALCEDCYRAELRKNSLRGRERVG